MFFAKPFNIKFAISLNGKASRKATKTALLVCSITFLQHVLRVISRFNACRLAPKLL